MQNAAQRLIYYPINYIAEVRKLSFSKIFLIDSRASPGYILLLLISYLSLLALGAFQIYYVFTHQIAQCYGGITWGIYTLSLLYVIQSTIICFFLISFIGQSTSWCLRSILIIFFGLILIGSCYGGIGSVWLCFLESQYQLYINKGLFVKTYFIHTIVYLYITFLATYIIITPILTILYVRRDANNNEIMDRSCTDYICCIFYYSVQLLMLVCFLCLFLIKILGPFLLLYILVELARIIFYQNFQFLAIFIIMVIGIFLPLLVFIIAFVLKSICCSSSNTLLQQQKSQQLQHMQSNKTQTPNSIQDKNSHKSSLISNKSNPPYLVDNKYRIGNSRL